MFWEKLGVGSVLMITNRNVVSLPYKSSKCMGRILGKGVEFPSYILSPLIFMYSSTQKLSKLFSSWVNMELSPLTHN